MIWWLWIVIGILLVCAEMAIPLDFFLIFIGLGFSLTGIFAYHELFPADWMQWAACAIFSLSFYLGLKKPLQRKFAQRAPDRKDDYVDEIVLIKQDIAPGETGAGELRGTGWQIKNLSHTTLAANSKHAVSRTDGIVLIVE